MLSSLQVLIISINVRPIGARGQRGREEAERAALDHTPSPTVMRHNCGGRWDSNGQGSSDGDKGAFHLQRDDAGSLPVLQRAIKPTLSWRLEGRVKVTKVNGSLQAGSQCSALNKDQRIRLTSQA